MQAPVADLPVRAPMTPRAKVRPAGDTVTPDRLAKAPRMASATAARGSTAPAKPAPAPPASDAAPGVARGREHDSYEDRVEEGGPYRTRDEAVEAALADADAYTYSLRQASAFRSGEFETIDFEGAGLRPSSRTGGRRPTRVAGAAGRKIEIKSMHRTAGEANRAVRASAVMERPARLPEA